MLYHTLTPYFLAAERALPCGTWSTRGRALIHAPAVELSIENLSCPLQSERFLKRYLEYTRSRVAPRVSRRAGETLAAEYVSLREEVRVNTASAILPQPHDFAVLHDNVSCATATLMESRHRHRGVPARGGALVSIHPFA